MESINVPLPLLVRARERARLAAEESERTRLELYRGQLEIA